MSEISHEVLGMIETRGFAAMVEAADTMMVACRAAVEAGSRAAEQLGEMVSVYVFPRPHESVDVVLPLGRQERT